MRENNYNSMFKTNNITNKPYDKAKYVVLLVIPLLVISFELLWVGSLISVYSNGSIVIYIKNVFK